MRERKSEREKERKREREKEKERKREREKKTKNLAEHIIVLFPPAAVATRPVGKT